jgi:hypothetical protein
MMSQQATTHRPLLAAGALVAALLAGCSEGDSALNQNPGGVVPPPESVNRHSAPSGRTTELVRRLNTLRVQTYQDELVANGMPVAEVPGFVGVGGSNELYTAAVRHAIYLNSINSAASVTSNGVVGPGEPGTTVTPEASQYDDLTDEDVQPASVAWPFPAMYTAPLPVQRVVAVRGGPDLVRLYRSDARRVDEMYVFNGNVWTNNGTLSAFRGFNTDNVTDLSGPVDNLWYSPRGRVLLMRATLRSIGFGNPYDRIEGSVAQPPYPILGGRFAGVFLGLSEQTLVAQPGFWPNNGNTDVMPYGLHTGPGSRGGDAYSGYQGPPIHFTLPVAEPLISADGALRISITKVAPETPLQGSTGRLNIYTNLDNVQVQLPALAAVPDQDSTQEEIDRYNLSQRQFNKGGAPYQPVTLGPINTIAGILGTNFSAVQFFPEVSLYGVLPGDVINVFGDAGSTATGSAGTTLPPTAFTRSFGLVIENGDRGDLESLDGLYQVGGGTLRVLWFGPDPGAYYQRFPAQPNAQGTVVSNRDSAPFDPSISPFLRDGEVVIVPVEPLEPNTTYEVAVSAQTITSVWSRTWRFTTNGKTPRR